MEKMTHIMHSRKWTSTFPEIHLRKKYGFKNVQKNDIYWTIYTMCFQKKENSSFFSLFLLNFWLVKWDNNLKIAPKHVKEYIAKIMKRFQKSDNCRKKTNLRPLWNKSKISRYETKVKGPRIEKVDFWWFFVQNTPISICLFLCFSKHFLI